MKRSTLLLITTFFITIEAQAQIYYSRQFSFYYTLHIDNFSFNSTQKERNLVYENRAQNNVKASQRFQVNRSNDTVYRLKTTYNLKGRITSVNKVDKKGKKSEIKMDYLNDTLLTHYKVKTNKKSNETDFKYNENGNLVHLIHLEKGKKRYEINKSYMGKHLIESVETDYRKRKPRTYKMINTINDKGETVKTAYYRNDELQRVWKYDCSEKGKEVATKKSEEGVPSSSSCSWKQESSDGSYIKYYRTLKRKSIYLYESHYNKDSVLVKTKTYDTKDRLIFQSTYYDNHKVRINYKNNGKVRRYFSESLDPHVGVISSTSVNYGLGKSHRSTQKLYNDDGLLVELAQSYNGKQSKTTMTYSYFNE